MNKKNISLLIFILFYFNFSYGQSWHNLTTGITGDFGVLTEATYNGELYMGGWFYEAGGVTANNMARWTGLDWDSVGSGLTGGENNVDAMCVYNGKLYVGGAFFAADGLSATNIASWDGTHWDTVGAGLLHCGSGAGWADAMCVYNGKLYVAGSFCTAGYVAANNIASWDGTKWDSLSSGINGTVYALAVYNGDLYAGGQFTVAGSQSVSNIAYWDGSVWNAVASGPSSAVLALTSYKGSLYVGGEFSSYIKSWNGSAWSSLGAGISTSTGSVGVEALCVFNGMLYVGGAFNKSGTLTINNIATWNGTVWDTVSTKGVNSTVDAFAVFDTAIFAGGEFTVAGTVAASDIAEWGGTNLGVNEISDIENNVTVYPNPNNGEFTLTCHSESNEESPEQIKIYNLLGERVFTETLHSVQGDNIINVGSQPAGIYLYRVTDESGSLVGQGKIVVQK